MRDHPGELRPRVPVGEDCTKILLNSRRSFDCGPPFLCREGLFSDGLPEARPREQLPDRPVVAAALQAADEVSCRPRLQAVEPLPRSCHIERVRNEVLTAASRPR